MARILRGVKSPFASSAGGGGLFSFSRSRGPVLWACPLQAWAFLPAIFSRATWIFRRVQFLAFLGLSFALCGLFSGWVWVWLGAVAFGALWGFLRCYSFCLRAVSTCKGKKAVLPLFFALPACLVSSLSLQGLPCLSLCRFILEGTKEKRPFVWVVSPWVVVFGFSLS